MSVTDRDCQLWRHDAVQCVLVADDDRIHVELRNAAGATFLSKSAWSWQGALNEAEYLRLLLRAGNRRLRPGSLKPFALVIDDDPDSSEALIKALKVSGMRAFACRSGAEGVSAARELMPDLIVLDSRLGDTTGETVSRLLRDDEVTATIPIIAVSAVPRASQFDMDWADAVLAKPCDRNTLTAAARLFVRHLSPMVEATS
jgi:CheY-like chemotaxis protein